MSTSNSEYYINQLDLRDLKQQHSLMQMVKVPTRGQHILDVFLTNSPFLWNKPTVITSLVISYHMAVLIPPRTTVKSIRKSIYIRDTREHHKVNMEQRQNTCDWSFFKESCNNVNNAVQVLF